MNRHLALVPVVLLGLLLRLQNAETAEIHGDEVHYAADARWSYRLPPADAVRFLRNHMRDHVFVAERESVLLSWGDEDRTPRIGHPTLLAMLLGPYFAVARPQSPAEEVFVMRRMNAVADSAAIAVVALLTTSLTKSTGAGLVASGLYAACPPAIAYGSLAYLDPLLGLFLPLALLATVCRPRSWLVPGLLAVLLISTKQTGLVALAIIPAAGFVRGSWSIRTAIGFAMVVGIGFFALNSPTAYVSGLLDPLDPYGRIRTNPMDSLWRNMGFLADPASYYWLSYTFHGRPLAGAIAPLHYVLTPAYVLIFGVSVIYAAAARASSLLVILYAPIFLTLALLPPSGSAWRTQLIFPLVCCAIAAALQSSRRVGRLLLSTLAALAVVWSFIPASIRVNGTISIGEILRRSELSKQPAVVYKEKRGAPTRMYLQAGEDIRYRFVTPPGRYRFRIDSTGWNIVSLDGTVVHVGATGEESVELDGYLHELGIEATGSAIVRRIQLLPDDGVSAIEGTSQH